MSKRVDKRRRPQRWFQQRLVAVCVVISLAAFGCFLYFGTDLFSPAEDASYTFKLLEPVNDSLAAKAKFQESRQGKKKRSHTQEKTVAVNVGSADAVKTVISAKDNKVVPTEESQRLSSSVKASTKTGKPAYEVRYLAHFYNKPSEKTRRKEVIHYWNQSYASIKPINEKNGFVFVEFKYPSGQRSEGWLRKKDLKKVNTAYQNNKE